MERVELIAGNEKRFFDFISRLNDKDRIAIISHTDLDGIASAKIVAEVIKPDFLKFINYHEFNADLIKELKKNKINKVIFTDFLIESAEMVCAVESFAELLVIDHHPVVLDYNSDKSILMNAQGYCAAYICYSLLSRVQNLEKWEWLVACASIADFMHFKIWKWIKEIYKKYKAGALNEEADLKQGDIWETQYELSLAIIYFEKDLKKVFESLTENYIDKRSLKEFAGIVQKEMNEAVKSFEREREEIGGVYYWEFKSKFAIRSILMNLLSTREPGKTFIFAEDRDGLLRLSARRQDKKEDVSLLLKKLVLGIEGSHAGGHAAAAGGHVPVSARKELKKRISNLG